MLSKEPLEISFQETAELKLVPQFKNILVEKKLFNPELHDDFLLARFIKARQFDLVKALVMFKKSETWRSENDIENIWNFDFKEKQKVFDYYPNAFHKTDKIGRLLWITRSINFDYESIKKVSTEDRVLRYHIRENEKNKVYRSKACSGKVGHRIGQSVLIIDLDGMPLMQIYSMMGFIQKVLAVDNDYYPECMGKIFVVNAGFLFSGIWCIIKPLLPVETATKVSIMGSKFQKELLELVDEENLPSFLGGSCNCPGGCEKADIGPWNDGSVAGYPLKKWEMEN